MHSWLAVAERAATLWRNHLELFQNGGVVCSLVANYGAKLIIRSQQKKNDIAHTELNSF